MAGKSRWMRATVAAVAVVVVLVAVVVAAAQMFIPTGAIRDRVVAAVHEGTGRNLAINGRLAVSLFPTLEVAADDVTLSNAPWAEATPMVRLARLEVRLKVLPLLSGRVEVGSFVLDRPVVDLRTDGHGHANWQFSSTPAAGAGAAAPATKPPESKAPESKAPAGGAGIGHRLSQISLGDVRVTGGRLTYTDGASGAVSSFDDIDLSIALPNLDSPLVVKGSLRFRDKSVKLALSVPTPRALMTANGGRIQALLTSDPATAAFDGTAALTAPLHAEGDASLTLPSLRAALAWIAGKPPALPGSGFGPASVAGHLTVNGDKVAFARAHFALDAAKGVGDLAYAGGGPRPEVRGSLSVDRLDLNPYLGSAPAPAGATKGGAAAPAAGKPAAVTTAAKKEGWSDAPIDVSALRAANVDLALEAGAITAGKVAIGKSTVRIVLRDGRLTLDPIAVALYLGTLKGRMALDAAGAVPAVTAQIAMDKVAAGPLLAAVANYNDLTGDLGGNVDLSSQGATERQLIGALAGKGRLSLGHGAFAGIDLVGLVKGAGGSGGRTEITEASGSFTVARGVATNRDLRLASSLLSATGSGTVDLPQRILDYRLNTKLASAISVPVKVSGPWDHIAWAPDLAAAIGGVIKQPGKLLDSAKGGLGKLLPGLLGK